MTDVEKHHYRAQGLERGLQQVRSDLVLRLLQPRCRVLSVDRQELVRSLKIDRLEDIGDVLLDFNGMDDLVQICHLIDDDCGWDSNHSWRQQIIP